MWHSFSLRHNLTVHQLEQFKKFYDLLREYNEIVSLTAIDKPEEIIAHHFDDSLALSGLIDLSAPLTLADIGSGGGFPGIPLKIKYPHLKIYLIEVKEKKVAYLKEVIEKLRLDSIEVIDLDWRTFLRKTEYKIDLFCARASLPFADLMRMFKPASPYKKSSLAYWASRHWIAQQNEKEYISKEFAYTIENRQRRLVLLTAHA